MLKSYLLAFVISLQALIGFNAGGQILGVENTPENTDLASSIETGQLDSRPVAESSLPLEIETINTEEIDYVKKLEDMGITLHPGTDFAADSSETPITLNRCASLVYNTFEAMPEDTVSKVKNLTLYFNSTGRRGLGGGSTIILRCQNVTEQEMVSVLVHELGHIKDTGVMQGNFWAGESEFRDGKSSIFENDLSLEFYRISFENDQELKADSTDLDFVSGYAKTDPFEDFAETYNYYLLHGDNFRQLARNNEVLEKKYNFMKEKVFDGQEFDFQSEEDLSLLTKRKYDSTVIGYNLEKFLAI
jgi:hypothetical protein